MLFFTDFVGAKYCPQQLYTLFIFSIFILNILSYNSLNSNLANTVWSQNLVSTGQAETVVSNNRRILNPDGTRLSFDNNKNHTYLVAMTSKTGSSESTFDSLSIVNFSSTGANVSLLSHTETVYPYPVLTAESQLITAMKPSEYSMSCIVSIIKLK